jgi:radical SAM-linked protein
VSDLGLTVGTLDEVSRHRITFATSYTLAYISVLELGTLWERTLRRARVPLKYSQGFNPRPRMHFAAPLPVGCGSDAELLDLSLEAPRAPEDIARTLRAVTPLHLTVLDIAAVADDTPALSEQLAAAEYLVQLHSDDRAGLGQAIGHLLSQSSLPLPRRGRRHRGESYDLRPLIQKLEMDSAVSAPWLGLRMRLSSRPGATGRPDEVLKVLGWEDIPRRCTRTRLILDTDRVSDPSGDPK